MIFSILFACCGYATETPKLICPLTEMQVQTVFCASEDSKQTQTAGSPLDLLTGGKASQYHTDFTDTHRGFKFKHQTGDLIVWVMKADIPSTAYPSMKVLAHAIQTGGYSEQLLVDSNNKAVIQSEGKILHTCGLAARQQYSD